MSTKEAGNSLSRVIYIYEKESNEAITLEIIFDALINGSRVEVNRTHLESVFNELNIDTKNLDARLIKVLCEALVYYISVWTGWLHSNKHSATWFPRFCEYLTYKSNFIIKNATRFIEEKGDVADQATQTVQVDKQKEIAPYTIVVGSPPSVLNNLIFTGINGNIVIKQHIPKAWQNLSVPEFLNWPFVTVDVKLPDISIRRSNKHSIDRLITLEGVPLKRPHFNHIQHITRIPEKFENEFKPYSHTFFSRYILQLNAVLQKMPNINKMRLVELAAIFTEFVKDVKEMKLYESTMSPYVTVGFNIGRCQYIRSKKMVNCVGIVPIKYFEIITPQVDTSLHYFKVKQDCEDNTGVTFESLNLLLKKMSDTSNSEVEKLTTYVNNSCVVYRCDWCREAFTGEDAYNLAITHFKLVHGGEHLVLCLTCGKQYEIHILCSQRWFHRCSRKK